MRLEGRPLHEGVHMSTEDSAFVCVVFVMLLIALATRNL